MLAVKESIKYSYKYFLINIILYTILGCNYFLNLDIRIIAVIPINFFALKYGMYKEINKDGYQTKYMLIFELIFITVLFNVIFLSLLKINIYVNIIFNIVNSLEIFYLDVPDKNNKKKNSI